MVRRSSALEPINFTIQEIGEARTGNYGAAEKRIKKELKARSRVMETPKPHSASELRKLAGRARHR
jgi:hypothetical protein